MFEPKINITPILENNQAVKLCKGDITKHFLIIFNVLEDTKENALLQKNIFKAIGFDFPSDFILIHTTGNTYFKISDILETYKIDHVISFGVPLKQLCVNLDLNAFESGLINDTIFLNSVSLSQLQESKAHKAALWQKIKSIFTT